MALTKEIELNNGVTTRYHRIVSVNTITNVQNLIEVASYASESKRHEELEAQIDGKPMNVFVHTRFIKAPYDQNMTIESAYSWIKANVADFEGASGDVAV